MMKKALRKLKQSHGESLAEVMVAVLIGAIALTFLASMIFTASKLVKSSSETMNAYYAANNNVESQKSYDGSCSLYVKTTKKVTVPLPKGASKVTVKYYVNSEDSSVLSYKK